MRLGYPPIAISPFPIGQGEPLPDATQAHLAPLALVAETGTVVGFKTILFLVSDTGGDILIANNLLDFLGILSYHPPPGYEDLLLASAKLNYILPAKRTLPEDVPTGYLTELLRSGMCVSDQYQTYLPTEIPALVRDDDSSNSDDHDNSMKHTPAQCLRTANFQTTKASQKKEGPGERTKDALKEGQNKNKKTDNRDKAPFGRDPPPADEVAKALEVLRKVAEAPPETVFSEKELAALQIQLAAGRPEWSTCLTTAHTQSPACSEAKRAIEDLMDGRFKDTVFSKTLEVPCNFPMFEIRTKPGADAGKAIQPRRFKDPKVIELIDGWLDGLIKDNLVQESEAAVAAPVTVVFKKDRDPRVCIDYRERNARSDVPIYPMPDVHDFLDEASGFNYYCSFDCTKMFNQIEIKPEHRPLAAFITHRGTFEPSRVLFGLQGGPQHAVRIARPAMRRSPLTNGTTFARWAHEQNLKGIEPPYSFDPKTGLVPGSSLDIFIDDCRVPSNNLAGLVKLCELWFQFCEEHRLILSRKKAKLVLTHLPFLGFVVSSKGKHLDPRRIACLLEATRPRSKEGLHAFLCSINFVRMFVPHFSSIAAPLYAASRGIIWKGPGSGRSKGTREVDPEFQWSDELERAINQLKTALLGAPILSSPNYAIAIFLSVDASLLGEGWVLWQLVTGMYGSMIPVAIHYGSKKYIESESAWEVTRQEAHAIKSALNDTYDYIFLVHFFLLTDHRNLTFLSNSVNRAVVRIRHFMQQFNMTVVHVPGEWNNPADGLSRLEPALLAVREVGALNSATTMTTADQLTTVSRGTSTREDGLHIKIHEHMDAGRLVAKALLTITRNSRSCCHDHCLLCHPELEAPEESVGLGQLSQQMGGICLRTTSRPALPAPICEDDLIESREVVVDPEVLDSVVARVTGRSKEESKSLRQFYLDEAIRWNQNLSQELAGVADLQEALETQERIVELEDLEWMESTEENRTAALLSTEPLIVIDSTATAEHLGCGSNFSTQTCPADFRATSVRSPMLEDFAAIHNHDVGHHGVEHSYRKLITRCGIQWANERGTATKAKAELKEYIENCAICQKIRGLQGKTKSKHSFITARPFVEVSYDFIVFDKPDKHGNRYLIVAVDSFTKLVEMKAVPDRGAEGVALFLMELRARYGPIGRLRSDKEKAFVSQVVTKLNGLMGSTIMPCIAYHPQANSVCERQNQIVMNHLRALVYGAKLGQNSAYAWSELIPFVFSIVNNTPKRPLMVSPLSMVYGVFGNYDRQILSPNSQAPGASSNPVDYVDGLMEWQNRLLAVAEDLQETHLSKMVAKYGLHDKNKEIQEGDFVLLAKHATGTRGKTTTRWLGPKLVLARRDNDPTCPVVSLTDLTTMKVSEVSIDDCLMFKTGWFEEETMLQDLTRLAALDQEEYVVENILEHRPPGEVRKRGTKPSQYWFRVKWAGFSDTENSWEPYQTLKDLEPLEEYLKKFPGLKMDN